jgi:hypothetical protein
MAQIACSRDCLVRLGAFVMALFPVSFAIPPSSARTANELNAIAARLKTPPGYQVSVYAMGDGARVMALTPKGDIILSLSFPKIPSGLDSHRKAESSHH